MFDLGLDNAFPLCHEKGFYTALALPLRISSSAMSLRILWMRPFIPGMVCRISSTFTNPSGEGFNTLKVFPDGFRGYVGAGPVAVVFGRDDSLL